jgi:hypothetical protein
MAKQNGLVKLTGTVGDMTYYRSKDGFLAKEKTFIPADRIATDPQFKRTRENMAEFGNACISGKTLRHSINPMLKNAKDGKLVSRLSKTMMQVLKNDTTSKRGKRTVATGDLSLLKGFEFNANAVLNTTLYAPFTVNVNRASGVVDISIPPFIPTSSVIVPQGATHFKLVAGAAAIDFTAQSFVSANTQSAALPWDVTSTAQITLSNTITAGSTLPFVVVFGIQFYQEVNGDQYPLTDKSFNALSIVTVDTP